MRASSAAMRSSSSRICASRRTRSTSPTAAHSTAYQASSTMFRTRNASRLLPSGRSANLPAPASQRVRSASLRRVSLLTASESAPARPSDSRLAATRTLGHCSKRPNRRLLSDGETSHVSESARCFRTRAGRHGFFHANRLLVSRCGVVAHFRRWCHTGVTPARLLQALRLVRAPGPAHLHAASAMGRRMTRVR